MNGKGKYYYPNGILEYEGAFIYDKPNGQGKFYDEHGRLRYKGEFLMEIKIGKGKNIMKMEI